MQVDRLLVAHQPRLTLAGDEQAADLRGDRWQKVPASNECDGGSNCEETDEHYCHRGDGPANRSSCCDTQAEREQGVSDDLRTLNIECEPLAVGIVRNSRGPFLSRHGEDSGHHNRCRAENGQLDEEPFATGDPLGPDHLVGALLKLTSQQGRTDEHARQHRQHDKSQIERLPKHPVSGVEGSERPPESSTTTGHKCLICSSSGCADTTRLPTRPATTTTTKAVIKPSRRFCRQVSQIIRPSPSPALARSLPPDCRGTRALFLRVKRRVPPSPVEPGGTLLSRALPTVDRNAWPG